VGQRRAEQRHDPVAHHLVHRPVVAVNGLHHAFQDGVENLPRLLRIAVREQLHRPLEIGEQHCDLFALALERAPGGEDLLGEVLGGVGLGRREFRRRRRSDQRRSALVAELVRQRIGCRAGGAE